MGAKSKSGLVRSAARKRAGNRPNRRGRRAVTAAEAWEPQFPGERDDELDFRRIVQGYGGRSLPPYYDDYN